MEYRKCDIISNAYIYIIYPSNYDVDNINTRQFYIGSTENITICRDKVYNELYKGSTSKKIKIMRKYMQDEKISLEDDKNKSYDKKYWQFRPIFIGNNCCTKSLLKALEGLYIYYYYSILNDEIIEFKPENINPDINAYFKYLDICNHLSKSYSQFDYEDLIYDVNPYTLITNDSKLKQYEHIYKEICELKSMPKFDSIDKLIYQCIIEKTVDEFYSDFLRIFRQIEPKKEEIKIVSKPNIYWIKGNDRNSEILYKCYYCDKTYKNVHWWLCEHLEKNHNVIISVKEARNFL